MQTIYTMKTICVTPIRNCIFSHNLKIKKDILTKSATGLYCFVRNVMTQLNRLEARKHLIRKAYASLLGDIQIYVQSASLAIYL